MIGRMLLLAIFLLILNGPAPRLDAGEQLVLMVSPSYSFAPATLRVRIRLAPHSENRALEIVADSPEYFRSSMIQLEGERAPRVVVLDFGSVPGGEYEIRGVLTDAGGRERACARQSAVVMSGPER